MNFGNFNARSSDKLNLPGAIDSLGHEIASFCFSRRSCCKYKSFRMF